MPPPMQALNSHSSNQDDLMYQSNQHYTQQPSNGWPPSKFHDALSQESNNFASIVGLPMNIHEQVNGLSGKNHAQFCWSHYRWYWRIFSNSFRQLDSIQQAREHSIRFVQQPIPAQKTLDSSLTPERSHQTSHLRLNGVIAHCLRVPQYGFLSGPS